MSLGSGIDGGAGSGVNENLFRSVDDPASSGVIGAHRHGDPIAEDHADSVASHLACQMGQDLEAVICFYAKQSTGQHFHNGTIHFDMIFFRH